MPCAAPRAQPVTQRTPSPPLPWRLPRLLTIATLRAPLYHAHKRVSSHEYSPCTRGARARRRPTAQILSCVASAPRPRGRFACVRFMICIRLPSLISLSLSLSYPTSATDGGRQVYSAVAWDTWPHHPHTVPPLRATVSFPPAAAAMATAPSVARRCNPRPIAGCGATLRVRRPCLAGGMVCPSRRRRHRNEGHDPP